MNRDGPHDAKGLVERVFHALADGHFHSGEELAQRNLALAAALYGRLQTRCVRWARPCMPCAIAAIVSPGAGEPLDADAHSAKHCPPAHCAFDCVIMEVAWTVTSTNSVLLERGPPPQGECEVALAEFQSAGRGRRGRAWFAPPGVAVCLSMSWTFAQVPRDVGSLSLAIGVCVLRALGQLGIVDLQLKSPDDSTVERCKVGRHSHRATGRGRRSGMCGHRHRA